MTSRAPTGLILVMTMTLVAIGPGSSEAAEHFYFAAAGNDGSSCASPQSPCQSVERANAMTYRPGDVISFHGGDRFSGCLLLDSRNVLGGGAASNPIVVGSYGLGRATLLSNCPGIHALVTIDGVSGVIVENLDLSANGTRTAIGLLIQNSIRNKIVETVIVRGNDIQGFNIDGSTHYGAEIFVSGHATNGNCGALNDIQITDNRLHGAEGSTSPDDNGITGFGCGHNITNVKYSGNEVFYIGGRALAPGGTSGNGIIANGADGGEVSHNLVHDNGANAATCGGPAGIWAFHAANIRIEFNEVYHMRPLPDYPGHGACDWAAFDLDSGVTASFVQYNYSHDNAGPGLLGFTGERWGPNTFRYNISENDQTMMTGASGSIAISHGGISYVYNNTIVRSGTYTGSVPPACISLGLPGVYPAGTIIANNMCINSMTDRLGRTRYLDAGSATDASAVTIANNLYYNPEGNDHWNWLNVDYASLAAFKTASGKDIGSSVGQPSVVGAGMEGPCPWTPHLANGPQPCPSGYALKAHSAAIGTGLNLALAPYALEPGSRDYYGTALPHHAGSGYNIGADGSSPY